MFVAGVTLAGISALALAVLACVNVTHDPRLSRAARLLWYAVVLVFPIFGSVTYFAVRNDW
jgi:hypothetical protein